MENSVSAKAPIPVVISNPSPSSEEAIQSEEANPNAPASNDAKSKQFVEMLDDQQQVTELGVKYEKFVFDAAQDVEINATYSEPAQAAKL